MQISKDDLEDLQSRLAAQERLSQDLIVALEKICDTYKGVCMIYGLGAELSPAYAVADSLIKANKKEI